MAGHEITDAAGRPLYTLATAPPSFARVGDVWQSPDGAQYRIEQTTETPNLAVKVGDVYRTADLESEGWTRVSRPA